MDDTDLRLCTLLLQNSRAPLAHLAKGVGTSAPSAFRRLDSLLDSRVIRDFTSHISLRYLNAVFVQVFGVSNSRCFEETALKLAENSRTARVLIGSGNYAIVSGYLRAKSELDQYAAFVRKVALIPHPTIGVVGAVQYGSENILKPVDRRKKLSLLDYRIINSLHLNSRKTFKDVGRELDVSARSVRMHIARMIREGTVMFTLLWDPGMTSGVSSFTRIVLKPRTKADRFRNELMRIHEPRIVSAVSYRNLPDTLMCRIWSPTRAEHAQLLDKISSASAVHRVFSCVLLREYGFVTWRDGILRSRCGLDSSTARHPLPAST